MNEYIHNESMYYQCRKVFKDVHCSVIYENEKLDNLLKGLLNSTANTMQLPMMKLRDSFNMGKRS